MKYQIMKPTVTYGMNVAIGWPNSWEYSPPSAAAVTPMLIVIHSGPITERRYRCLMSCHPSCSQSSCWLKP